MGDGGEQTTLYLQALAMVAAALLGGAAGAIGAGPGSAGTRALASFAAGSFLAVALLHLLPEAGHQAGWVPALLAAGVGFFGSQGLGRRFSTSCPACAGAENPTLWPRLSASLMLVVGIHCVLDGVALAGFAGHDEGGEVLSMALLAHKLPEGIGLAAVVRGAGRSIPAALGITTGIELLTLVGLMLGLLAGTAGGFPTAVLLGVVAGSFLYLVTLTLSGVRSASHPALTFGSVAAGALLIVLARLASGDAH